MEHNTRSEERQRLALAFWGSVRRPWKAATCTEDVNGIWTWAAEEFVLMGLSEDSTVESTLHRQCPRPPMLKTDPQELGKRGPGTQHTVATTKLCPNKKMPSGVRKTRVIWIMDAAKGALKPVLRYIRAQETPGRMRPGRWPREVQQCGHSAHRGLERL